MKYRRADIQTAAVLAFGEGLVQVGSDHVLTCKPDLLECSLFAAHLGISLSAIEVRPDGNDCVELFFGVK